jgi:hypothetical protein
MPAHIVRHLCLAGALATVLAGCGSSKAAATDVGSSTISQYLTGIDDQFADMKGKQFGDNAMVTKYTSKVTMPNTNACVISHVKKSGDTIATCFFVAATQAEADKAFVAAKQDVRAAAPQLAGADEPPTNGNLAQYFSKDDKHAIYIDEGLQDDGKYTVVTSFGTPAALK